MDQLEDLGKVSQNYPPLEKEIKEIDVELAVNYEETVAKTNFFEHYQAKKDRLEKLMENWEHITLQLEEFN